MKCCVPGCKNYNHSHKRKNEKQHISYHLLPKSDFELKQQWITAICREKDVGLKRALRFLKENFYVCSVHFEEAQFSGVNYNGRKRLLPGSVPVKFPWTKSKKKKKSKAPVIKKPSPKKIQPVATIVSEEKQPNGDQPPNGNQPPNEDQPPNEVEQLYEDEDQLSDISSNHSSVGLSMSSENTFHILVGCTGSVASIKIPLLIRTLQALTSQLKQSIEIRVVATKNSLHFFKPDDVAVAVLTDELEWNTWRRLSDSVLHIELRRWADLMVIAPLDANTLGKISNGICDNLLTCIVRAWDPKKPLLFCPAMNTYMWEHPLTAQQIAILESFGYIQVPPISKKLACGDEGMGAMASVEMIPLQVANAVSRRVINVAKEN